MCARINTEFINPYNFIPFDNQRQVSRPETENGELSGVISYSIYTKTPLIIPNTSNPDTFKLAVNQKEDEAKRGETGIRKADREEESRNSQEAVQEDVQKDIRKDVHKSYDFFSYDDLSGKTDDLRTTYRRPVIPGSELRGLIRSQYEILTDSCLSSVDTDDVLSKRTQEKYKAGLLKKTKAGYELYEAEDCLLRTRGRNSLSPDLTADWEHDSSTWSRECYIQDQLKEGERVWVRKHDRGYRIKPLITGIKTVRPGTVRPNGWLDGYVLKGVAGPDMSGNKQNKHCCHVFLPGGRNAPLSGFNCDEALSRLDDILDAYERNGESDYSEYRSAFIAFRNGRMNSCFPVYYSCISEVRNARTVVLSVTLSPAVITRESYTHTVKDMVGSHTPCSDPAHLCPACSLFGTVGKEGNTTFQNTSRIRVCDAFLDQGTAAEEAFRFEKLPKGLPEGSYDPEHGIFTLQPLSSPKLNNLEFYLKRPEGAWFWTYDYMIDENGNLTGIAPALNGRKFYWHNMAWYRNALTSERSNQNMSVRPVAPGNVFHGKIFFDHLTAKELNMLCFVLNAGEKTRETIMEGGSPRSVSEKKHGYKLGAAKPLGFGSISVQIEGVKIHCMRLDQEAKKITMQDIPYTEYDPDGYKEPQIDQSILSDFMKMTDFRFIDHSAPGMEVRYPVTGKPDEPEIFKWFVANHSGYRRRDNEPIREIGMPNSRNTMVYKHYLSPMEPRLQSTGFEETVYGRGRNSGQGRNGRQAGYGGQAESGGQARNGRRAGNGGGVQKELSVWAAQYGLKNRDSLPLIHGRKIYYESTGEWATEDNLKTYADSYRTVLLPGRTSDHLKNLARTLFDHVLVATRGEDGKDNGWQILK